MTVPVAFPTGEGQRAIDRETGAYGFALYPDPLRPPLTDEEPWSPCDAPAPTVARWWLVALAAVLLLLGLRALARVR